METRLLTPQLLRFQHDVQATLESVRDVMGLTSLQV